MLTLWDKALVQMQLFKREMKISLKAILLDFAKKNV